MAAVLVLTVLGFGCAGETAEEDVAGDTGTVQGEMGAEAGDTGAMGKVTDPIALLQGTHPTLPGGAVIVAGTRYTAVGVEGDTLIYGHLRASGDTIFLNDEGGERACMGQEGVYTVHLIDGEPHFELVEDPCEGRRDDLLHEDGTEEGMEGGAAPEA